MENTEDIELFNDARERVRKLKRFYSNLGAFVLVNIMLLAINLITSPNTLWFYWVTLIWGIFLAWNAFTVFSGQAIMGKDWEEKKIQEYMKKK